MRGGGGRGEGRREGGTTLTVVTQPPLFREAICTACMSVIIIARVQRSLMDLVHIYYPEVRSIFSVVCVCVCGGHTACLPREPAQLLLISIDQLLLCGGLYH